MRKKTFSAKKYSLKYLKRILRQKIYSNYKKNYKYLFGKIGKTWSCLINRYAGMHSWIRKFFLLIYSIDYNDSIHRSYTTIAAVLLSTS